MIANGPKPHPLIVFFKLNYDLCGMQAFIESLPQLQQLGYRKICVEMPVEDPQNTIMDTISTTIKGAENLVGQVISRGGYRGNAKQFLETVPFLELIQNLQKLSPQFEQMTHIIESLRPNRVKKEGFSKWIASGLTLHGIDKNWPSQLDPQMPIQQRELLEKLSEITIGFNRSETILMSLQEHFATEGGTIVELDLQFLPLIQRIMNICNGNCLFVFPRSSIYRQTPVDKILKKLEVSTKDVDIIQDVDTKVQRENFIGEIRKIISAKMTSPSPASAYTPTFTLQEDTAATLKPSALPRTNANATPADKANLTM